MGKIRTPNRIREEDFSEEIRADIAKLTSINNFQDDVVSVLNGNVDFENLNRQKAQFDVTTDATGTPVNPPQIKLSLKSKPYGVHIVRIDNLLNPGTYPTHMPFIAFTFSDVLLTVTAIKGLTASAKYRIYVEIIGA